MNKHWKIIPDNFKHSFQAESLDYEGAYEAKVCWDGCVDLTRIFDGEDDSIHICDLDDFISRLQELKTLGANYFNNEEWK
jgi:hypothetical protein